MFKNFVDESSIRTQYVIEAENRMEEILTFMKELNLQIDLNPIELNNNIQTIVKAFKIYEKPRSNYKSKQLIGSGITSSVYRAEDLSQNTNVAIKEFAKSYFSDEDAVVRFKREISLLATLDHPYIVKFIGFNFDLDHPFWVICEFAPDGDLYHAKTLNGFQKTKIMFEIAEGMEYLHDKHILHRDLKPLNVLLVGDTPKITDFGYSKSNLSLYSTERVGTPQYMAPEVLKGETYGYPADVASFARMLWELYYGEHPWFWLDNSKLFTVISTGSQPLPFEKPISPELKALIIAGDNMDPALRPTFSAILNIMIQQQIAYPGADREQVRQFYAEKARARAFSHNFTFFD